MDVVNSLDYSRGLMRSEKLGAPMARVSLPIGLGQLDLFAIGFVKNMYPPIPRTCRDEVWEQIMFSGVASK